MPGLYEGKKDWEHDVIREGEENILYIYVEGISFSPSIEDYDISGITLAKQIICKKRI